MQLDDLEEKSEVSETELDILDDQKDFEIINESQRDLANDEMRLDTKIDAIAQKVESVEERLTARISSEISKAEARFRDLVALLDEKYGSELHALREDLDAHRADRAHRQQTAPRPAPKPMKKRAAPVAKPAKGKPPKKKSGKR